MMQLLSSALARVNVTLAAFLAPLQIRRLGPGASAILQAGGVGAPATGFVVFSRDTLVDVIECHHGDRNDDQCPKKTQASLQAPQ